jgi:hypothetical protein
MAINVVDQYGFDPTGAADNAAQFTAMVADISNRLNRRSMPRFVFPEGQYQYSACPNLAFHNLEIAGEGQCEWHYTGSGTALTFDGISTGPGGGGKFNMWVDGIRVVPTDAAADTVVINSVHHSYFRIRAYGAGAPRGGNPCKAIALYWCVCTELQNPTVTAFDAGYGMCGGGSYDCVGIWLDHVTQPSVWQTTDCRFLNPIIEGVRVGIQLQDAGGCMFSGGTVESCTDTGINMVAGGQNRAWGLWLENNTNHDIVFGSGAKNNDFAVSHPSPLHVQNNAPLANNEAHGIGLFG